MRPVMNAMRALGPAIMLVATGCAAPTVNPITARAPIENARQVAVSQIVVTDIRFGSTDDAVGTAAPAKARLPATDGLHTLAAVDAVASVSSRVGGPVRYHDRVRPGITDIYTIIFHGRRRAEVAIAGNGVTDLDLAIHDENGLLVCASASRGDRERCRWTPKWTGPFKVRVRNRGRRHNTYWLLTN